MRIVFCLFSFLFLLAALPSSLYAQPRPSQHPVQDIEAQLQKEKQRERELQAQMKNLEGELSGTRKELVALAQKIKKNEKQLLKIEGNIEIKRQEQLALEVKLNEDQGSLSKLILAMERMRRIPPEAILARPGAPLETAQSAMLLEDILPKIYKRAEELKTNLGQLKSIVRDLKSEQEKALTTAKKLNEDHRKIEVLLQKREKMYARTAKDAKNQQAQLKEISKQAANLKDLVSRIEKQQRAEEKRRKETATTYQKTPLPKAGQAQLPISGVIKVAYGKTDEIGAVSEGIKVLGRAKALVVSPMGGVIDYAGPFKGYGNIIIIKHRGSYHSLIAGLDKIDTVVGRAVSAGEPIGVMGPEGSTLYYELRYKGKPVSPSKKIAGL
ncbi:MAG: peptidoglycan DD-metalloendopeptidase family protein [Alphaproteobacteria bacterium]|nr:peptidoglycan DD-metalloendopeptidase family protein [Alphaproteobacteria bacterium]